MSNAPSPCIIPANPDVTGIGVRVSIYILSLSLNILNLASNSRLTVVHTSIKTSVRLMTTALLFTGIIACFQGHLSYFHTICLAHLLLIVHEPERADLQFHTFNDIVRRKKYSTQVRWLTYVVFDGCVLVVVLLFLAFLFLSEGVASSERDPQCRDAVRLFFINQDAGDRLQKIFLQWLVIPYILIFGFEATVTVTMGLLMLQEARENKLRLRKQTELDSGWQLSRALHRLLHGRSQRHHRIDNEADSIALYHFVVLLIRPMLIAGLEYTIGANKVEEGEQLWSFGQVFAMITLMGPVIDFASWFSGLRSETDERAEAERARLELQDNLNSESRYQD